jgi:HTH-type transcriptional regulator, sugar sensing transcriptional regulator
MCYNVNINLINMDLIQSLKNIGLNEKEAQIYIALLQLGKATPYQVSKHSQIKKPTTYVILEGLIDKGIVEQIPRTKTLQYMATSPEDIFAMAQSKLETAQESLPELKALAKRRKRKVTAKYYEGLKGLEEMYNQQIKIAKGKELLAFYAQGKNTPPELWQLWDQLSDDYLRHKIKRKAITTHDKTIIDFIKKHPNVQKLTKTKLLDPEKYSSNISIEIYKNFTQITSHRYMQGIVIDNPDVAAAMKQIFKLVWERQDIEKNKK